MIRSPALASFQASLLAAMGLAACSGNVVTGETGSTTGTGGGTTTTTTGTGASPPAECAGAEPVPTSGGAVSGFSRCPDGTIHRVTPVTCSVDEGVTACAGTETMLTCKSDADCTTSPHGRCASYTQDDFNGPETVCGCVYPCAADAECQAGQVCVCAGVVPANQTWSACVPAACASGAACPSGECGISSYANGCGYDVELACRAPSDACRTDAQCASMPGTHCALAGEFNGGTASWSCAGTTCAIGRPLIVGGAPRTAPAVDRGDWIAAAPAPSSRGLDAPTREALASHWRAVAALEHASVASFARFTLELCALGAPPELLADAQRAALDEVEHARLAYALAGAYAGRPVGPGPLDLDAALRAPDARTALRSLVIEGCVGETLGVAEALALADRAADPALVAVYARVAADEQRHAELAWRTLRWLLRDRGDGLAELARAVFAEAAAEASIDPAPRGRVAPEHGLLAATELGAIRRQALREVVAPCAAALLGAA